MQYAVQSNRVRQRVCELTPTVVEGVHVDDNATAIIVSVRPNARAPIHHPGTTDEPVGDVGDLSMPAQLRCSVRPTFHGSSAGTKIRSLTRIAFGFHSPDPLIALALLALGSHPPQLPGRN